jgi:hypothetical protein
MPIHGLLFSQIGYEPDRPVRVIVRSTSPTFANEAAICRLRSADGLSYDQPLRPWGTLWGSHWWIAAFPTGVQEGEYDVSLSGGVELPLRDVGLRVKSGVLWDSTLRPMAVEMLQTRQLMAKAKSGWMDAGMMWQESNAHSSMILGLLDVLEHGHVDADTTAAIEDQVVNGCNYLVVTQDKAAERGEADGALCHDVIGHEKEILPNDANKAVVAWRRTARILSDRHADDRSRFASAADRAWRWLREDARPMGDYGFSRFQRGLPDDTPVPGNVWPTRDLVMLCWGAFEGWRAGDESAKQACVDVARQIMARQVSAEEPEAGFYGHFREFDTVGFTEKSWTHSIMDGVFGVDAGGSFPNYLVVLVEMLEAWPDHADAPAWRQTLTHFANGFLIPGCRANPFGIVPQGVFGIDGLMWFPGPFHGMNAIYGLTAALACELHRALDDPELLDIAYGNLQWIAGLNAGLTRPAMETGCVVYRTDIEPDHALPVSMIHGIGSRTAGTWFGTRGVICNGFSAGEQFKFDVPPTPANDRPSSFTDEDWIPHSAGWLSGLTRLINR